jgi:hypothetical protein
MTATTPIEECLTGQHSTHDLEHERGLALTSVCSDQKTLASNNKRPEKLTLAARISAQTEITRADDT